MNTTTIPIKGMHCRSCELLIEEELKEIPAVVKAVASEKKKCTEIYYEGENLNSFEVQKAIERAGYQVGIEEKKPLFSKNPSDYIDIIVSVVALFLLFILVDIFGLSKFFASYSSHPSSLASVLLIGITAGFSTCMALVGGLVLGVSARFSEKHPDSSVTAKFTPHLFFNFGRISSYIIFGGIIGLAGSFFQLSGFSLGLMTLAIALVMFTLGLQLTGIFPRIKSFSFTLPKGIGRLIGLKEQQNKKYSHKNSFILGAMTFFLPCGFTQAMQLLAISSGNFFRGAAIMGVFAIGTAPGLLGIGGLTSVMKGFFAQKFFRFAGVLVTILAIFNAQNGLNLMGISPQYLLSTGGKVLAVATGERVESQDGVQVVKMTQSANGYSPNVFTVVKDIPVKWVINSTEPNSCASSLISSQLNIRRNLHPGENIIDFTPSKVGRITFSCSMGMFSGVFNVVEKNGNNQGNNLLLTQENNLIQEPTDAGHSCGIGNGCGCGRRAKQQNSNI